MSAKLVLAKFRLGHIVSTPNALSQLTQEDILMGIQRHQAGDWGDLDSHDWNENERALKHGGRLFSQYQSHAGLKFWIITESSRDTTTVLLPEDY